MSDLNEEFLNDEDGDYPDVTEADEEALLQDDEDVLNIVPEEDLNETLEDSRTILPENEEKRTDRQKFSTERQKVTAPEKSSLIDEKLKVFKRPRLRYNRRGGNQARRFFPRNYQHERNRTVLINPRFQGTVHVNNNARLAWDNAQAHRHSINPWNSGGVPLGIDSHIQSPGIQMPPMNNIQSMHMPGHHQMEFVPPQPQCFLSQPLPPGLPPQPLMQSVPSCVYWDGAHNQYISSQRPTDQLSFQMPGPPMDNAYMHYSYQQPPPVINTSQPPPQLPQHNIYPQENIHHGLNLNFVPPNQIEFHNNQYRPVNQGQGLITPKRRMRNNGNFVQNNKKFVKDRLGHIPQPPVEDRIAVVTEVKVSTTTTIKTEEDEETKDLRQKIEAQKRKRQEVLQWKEQRRLESLRQANAAVPQPRPIVEEPIVILRKSQLKQPVVQHPLQVSAFKGKKQNNNIVLTNGYSKKFTKYQKNCKQISEAVIDTSTIPETQFRRFDDKQEPDLVLDEQHVQNFLIDRKVLIKDDSLMSTRQVVIKNISTSTGDKKIFQICKNIGEVQM